VGVDGRAGQTVSTVATGGGYRGEGVWGGAAGGSAKGGGDGRSPQKKVIKTTAKGLDVGEGGCVCVFGSTPSVQHEAITRPVGVRARRTEHRK